MLHFLTEIMKTIFALPLWLNAQTATLEVKVHDVASSEGDIYIALYREEETFLKFEHVYRTEGFPAEEGTTHAVIEDLPHGGYALAILPMLACALRPPDNRALYHQRGQNF